MGVGCAGVGAACGWGGLGSAGGGGAGTGGAAGPDVASSADCSSLGFLRDEAVVVDFSRGRRGARAGFSLSLESFSFLVLAVSVESSSFLRRDRLVAPEARRALDPSGLASASTGDPSWLGTPDPGESVDMVRFTGE